MLEGTSEKTKIAWPKNLRGHLKILHPFGVLRNEQRREDRSTPTAQDRTKMCSKKKLALHTAAGAAPPTRPKEKQKGGARARAGAAGTGEACCRFSRYRLFPFLSQ